MIYLKPLDPLIPKIPFSFFSDFGVWVTSEARGSVSVGFWGSRQGVGLARALSTPPPPLASGSESPPAPEAARSLVQITALMGKRPAINHFPNKNERRCSLER